MAKVMTRGGKPLIKNGKVAITNDGCCGPCGSPIGPCPDPVTITFHGVTFPGCCGGNSNTVNDVDFNETATVVTPLSTTRCPGVLDCFWGLSFTTGRIEVCFWENPDCSCNDPDCPQCGIIIGNVIVGKKGTTWYVFAFDEDNDVLFMGSGTDPSNIPNSVSCGVSSFTSPLLTCYGGTFVMSGMGIGGHATIT